MTRLRTKYGNRRCLVGGIWFDSQKEAARYQELLLLRAGRKIRDLTIHPRFELAPAFIHGGHKVRAVVYEADFSYHDCETDRQVVEDVKSAGTRTQVYAIKRKLFLREYGDSVDFREVD